MSGCGSGGCGSGGCGSGGKTPEPIAFDGSDENPLTLTASAIEAVKNAIKEEGQPGDGLRVSVVGGGCSGYQYNLDFEKDPRAGDLSLDFDGVRVFVDPVSAGYLKGTVVDFISGLQGTGFKFNNPNAKRTCGCGSSFS
jgi:iron-sulfur cluster assembly accessory protein